MNKISLSILGVLLVAIADGAGFWLGGRQIATPNAGTGASESTSAKGGASSGQPVAVEVSKVARIQLPQAITAVGSLRSDESVTLRPEVAGRISAITFQEGQRVSKGVPLLKLDPAIPDAELAQARANLTLAKAKFDRAVDLANRNYIS